MTQLNVIHMIFCKAVFDQPIIIESISLVEGWQFVPRWFAWRNHGPPSPFQVERLNTVNGQAYTLIGRMNEGNHKRNQTIDIIARCGINTFQFGAAECDLRITAK